MRSLLEYHARAALCRRLARLEPDCKNLWLAEADRWSALTQKSAASRGAPVEAWERTAKLAERTASFNPDQTWKDRSHPWP
jgi:hypothetical protein